MPGVIYEDDSANKNKVLSSEIVKIISVVDGFQNIDEENVEDWLNKDKNGKGYKILSDERILDAVSGEQSKSEEWEQSEDEYDATSVSHETALQCIDQLLDYMGHQNNFEFNNVISACNVCEIIRKNATLAR